MTDHLPDMSPAGPTRYASTAQVAAALGVSVTTVKRWVDDGVIPAQKSPGGHRKMLMADVVRLAGSGKLPQADLGRLIFGPVARGAGDLEALRGQLAAALFDADAEVVRALLHSAYQQGYPVETLADIVIGPAVAEIGVAWENGRIGVMHEHRATQALVGALYELAASIRLQGDHDRPVAVGGAVEGDPTILCTLLAKLVLLDAGWDAINLGPHTPLAAFRSALDELQPRLVWLCVTHPEAADRFLEDYAAFAAETAARGVLVVAGGRG